MIARILALSILAAAIGCGGPGQGLAPAPIREPKLPSQYWQEVKPPFPISDIHFVDRDHGCVVSYHQGIFWTEDGGEKWQSASAPKVPKLGSISFRTSSEGFAAGGDFNPEEMGPQRVLKSIDGGRTWGEFEISPPPPRHFLFNTIRWVSSNAGYLHHGILLKTTDAGKNWKELPNDPVSDVVFADENRAWSVSGSKVFRSMDGGISWGLSAEVEALLLWHEREWIRHIRREPAGSLWLFGSQGSVLQSRDDGKSWVIMTRIPRDHEVMDSHFADARRGWALLFRRLAGWSEIIRTDDGGTNWVRDYWVHEELSRLFFISDRAGWAAGTTLVIYRR